MLWNNMYFGYSGPTKVMTKQSQYTVKHQQLLSDVINRLHPQYTNDTLCTSLIGTPGSHYMDFVNVQCDTEVHVSGIMCMKGGTGPVNAFNTVHDITHWLLWKNPSIASLPFPEVSNFNLINTDRYAHTNITITEEFADAYNSDELLLEWESKLSWKWWHAAKSCSSCCRSSLNFTTAVNSNTLDRDLNTCVICKMLHRFSTCVTGEDINQLSQKISFSTTMITKAMNMTIRSGTMVKAIQQCQFGWVPVQNQCVKLVESSHEIPEGDTVHQSCNTNNGLSCTNKQICSFTEQIVFSKPFKTMAIDWNLGFHGVVFLNGTKIICLHWYFKQMKGHLHTSSCKNHTLHYLALCLPPKKTECPPGYATCKHSCIADKYGCLSRKSKPNCVAKFQVSTSFCYRECHSDNCTCNRLFFQCPSGGCLHSSKLCDGVSDCLHNEDELICGQYQHDTIGKILLKQFVGGRLSAVADFFPDEPDASDEINYINLLKSTTIGVSSLCIPGEELSCMKGHPTCYPVDKQCVYDRTEQGSLKYCRNAAHLIGCTSRSNIQCSSMFKCHDSYCIPIHLLCDGTLDCPHGDDESECPITSCHNMLHCGNICVHPNEICDGVSQCEGGEDELMCGAPVCPLNCECLGYTVYCQGLRSFDFNSASLGLTKILIVRQSWESYSLNTLTLPSLLILDVSHNLKYKTLKSELVGLRNLQTLLLSNNSLSIIAVGFFQGVESLRKLDLSWNALKYLQWQSFKGLRYLDHVVLHHCELTAIDMGAVSLYIVLLDISFNQLSRLDIPCDESHSQKVDMVIILANNIRYINTATNSCVSQFISDQKGFCCLSGLSGRCTSDKGYKCKSLLQSYVFVYTCTIGIFILIHNIAAMIYNLYVPDVQSISIALLSLTGLLITEPLFSLIIWHAHYQKELLYHEIFISKHISCMISQAAVLLSQQLSVSIWLFISVYKCYGVTALQIKISPTVTKYTNISLGCTCIVWFILINVAVSSKNSPNTVSQCLLNNSKSGVFLLVPIFGFVNIVSCLIVVALQGQILRLAWKSHLFINSQKHGQSVFLPVAWRLSTSIIHSISTIIPSSIFMILAVLTPVSDKSIFLSVIILFPMQSLSFPLLHTFTGPKFIAMIKKERNK